MVLSSTCLVLQSWMMRWACLRRFEILFGLSVASVLLQIRLPQCCNPRQITAPGPTRWLNSTEIEARQESGGRYPSVVIWKSSL